MEGGESPILFTKEVDESNTDEVESQVAIYPRRRSSLLHRKSNSEASFEPSETSITSPCLIIIADVVSAAFTKLIAISNEPSRPKPPMVDIMDEEHHSLFCSFGSTLPNQQPTLEEVRQFVFMFIDSTSELLLCSEVLLMCLCYVDRIIRRTNAPFNTRTWRRMILGALIVAMKVWDELAVFNEDFNDFFPHVPVTDLSALEVYILQLIDFDVTVTSSQYAKYYFEVIALRRNLQKE